MTILIRNRWLRLAGACTAAGLLALTTGHPTLARLEAQAAAYGIAAKRPVFGGACAFCPWGALADVVVAAMKTEGYDVQVCYTCSGANSVRIVSEARVPGPRSRAQISFGSPPPPKAAVDFGATNMRNLWHAYARLGEYQGENLSNLRLFARIEQPSYLVVGVRKESPIRDLADIVRQRMKVRVFVEGNGSEVLLAHYGITAEVLQSFGGRLGAEPTTAAQGRGAEPGGRGAEPGGRGAAPAPPAAEPVVTPDQMNPGNRTTRDLDYDVYIHATGLLANHPEGNIWYQASQKYEMRFLDIPDPVIAKLVSDFGMERVDLPRGYLAGVDRRIPTAGLSGQVVYGRVDAPEDFAYAVARAMDRNKGLLKWSVLPFSYDAARVWKTNGNVPLHPGAARYYREVGYLR
jgi:TRAP-type uncharacterized transport system substrate-binding protein